MDVLLHCADHSNLRSQALEVVKLVVGRDYPLRWPTFLSQCVTLVSTGDDMKVYCGLACLRVIAREFESKTSNKSREHIEELIKTVLPGLLSLGEQLSKTVDQVVSATLLKFILKIFYSSIQSRLSISLADHATCTRWFELCSILCKAAPTDPSVDIEEAVHGKLQKWGLRIFHRFFARYGNPKAEFVSYLDSEPSDLGYDPVAFSEWWLSACAPPLVNMVSELVRASRLSKAARHQAISFLTEAVQHGVTYKVLKIHLQSLLFDAIFPLMCFKEEDKELWESDPEEFVRREFDCMMAFSDPRASAVHFLKKMVSLRSKDSLAGILKFCESHLFAEHVTDIERCAKKDGALGIIGAIAPELCVACVSLRKKKKKALSASAAAAANRLPDKTQLEMLLAQFVLPDFTSPVGFLRYRACWVYEQFADERFPFSNPHTTEAAFAGFRSCLSDRDLPVRVQAGCSVKSFIEHEDLTPMIAASVPELLDKLLKLMHEIDCEPLASTLESLVTEYSEQVLPFAAQAIDQLAKVFVRLLQSEDIDDEAQLACMGSIQTICTIMDSASGTPPMYASLEPVCYPIIDAIMTPNGVDYMDEALDMLTYLTFYVPEPLTPGLWKYFDLIHQSVCGGQLPGFPLAGTLENGWAVDYTENMLNTLDNYISRSTSTFVSGRGACGRPYIQMLLEIVSKALANDSEITQIAGARIAACVFESCPRGSVDDWLRPYMEVLWRRLSLKEDGLNRWILYFLTMTLYYDPVAVARTVSSMGISDAYFQIFAELGKLAKSKDERKSLVIALCGLIKRIGEIGSGPSSAHIKAYVELLAVETKEIADQRRKVREAAAEGSEDEDDDEDDDDDFEDYEIDLQDLDESQSADQTANINRGIRIRNEIAQIREQLGNADESDDDDSEWEDYEDEDCERVSPLDVFNEFAVVKETLTGLDINVLLGWFSKDDLMAWNALLDENWKLDQQEKQ
jgi:importin-7